jgi:phosphatidylinositol alpha-1,6-mannosyltransferase
MLPLLRLGHAEKVVFLHGTDAWRPQTWVTRLLLGRMDRFLTNTQYTWERFLLYQPQLAHKPHHLVQLGIGSRFEGESPSPDAIPAVLMLGRLDSAEDYKGHRQIIAAWPRVLQLIPGARLWIAGDGDLRPTLEAQVKRCGVESAVHFWGRVTEERKQDLLQRSRCLAMPSRGEGFGLVYLEAMRVGRPCLVSTHDAAREVVAPPLAGLEVDPDQPVPLVEALVRLMSEGPEWQRWSRDARSRYEKEFTAEKFQSRLVAALFKRESSKG